MEPTIAVRSRFYRLIFVIPPRLFDSETFRLRHKQGTILRLAETRGDSRETFRQALKVCDHQYVQRNRRAPCSSKNHTTFTLLLCGGASGSSDGLPGKVPGMAFFGGTQERIKCLV